jgi:hypothetical protein
MWISFTESVLEPPPFYIGDELVERVDKFKLGLLGMGLQNGTIMLKLLYRKLTVKYIS